MRALPLALILAASPALSLEDLDGTLGRLPVAHHALVETEIADVLSDPKGAQFRSVHLVDTRKGFVVCGEVNARNRFGGYNGFEPFAIRTMPGGRRNVLAPVLYEPGMRPLMRRMIVEEGC